MSEPAPTTPAPVAPDVPVKRQRSREPVYFCRTCCATFHGDAAQRHRSFMQREYARRTADSPLSRIA